MSCRNPLTNKYLAGSLLGAILAAVLIGGCTADTGPGDGGDSEHSTASPASSEREGSHSGDEHGGGEGSGGNGEHGSGSEGGGEGSGGNGEHGSGSEGGGESSEAAMSSPITPLEQGWSGVLGGLAVSMQYDRSNPVRPWNGAEHARKHPLLRTGRTSPEVGNEDRGRAWP